MQRTTLEGCYSCQAGSSVTCMRAYLFRAPIEKTALSNDVFSRVYSRATTARSRIRRGCAYLCAQVRDPALSVRAASPRMKPCACRRCTGPADPAWYREIAGFGALMYSLGPCYRSIRVAPFALARSTRLAQTRGPSYPFPRLSREPSTGLTGPSSLCSHYSLSYLALKTLSFDVSFPAGSRELNIARAQI